MPPKIQNPGPCHTQRRHRFTAFAPDPGDLMDGETQRTKPLPVKRWDLVAALGERGSAPERPAMTEIYQSYWYPLYAYARSRGMTREDAQDCTQGLFCSLIARDSLQGVVPERGSLRAFLLGAMKRHMAGEFRSRQAQKRGSGVRAMPIDPHLAEQRLRQVPDLSAPPDRMHDLRWALLLIAAAMEALQDWYVRMQHGLLFEAIQPFLEWNQEGPSYRKVAEELRTTEPAVRGAVFLMRRRFRRILECKVRETVTTDDEARDEMKVLFQTLAGSF